MLPAFLLVFLRPTKKWWNTIINKPDRTNGAGTLVRIVCSINVQTACHTPPSSVEIACLICVWSFYHKFSSVWLFPFQPTRQIVQNPRTQDIQTTKPLKHKKTKPSNHQNSRADIHQKRTQPNIETPKPPEDKTKEHQTTEQRNNQKFNTKLPNDETTKPPNY